MESKLVERLAERYEPTTPHSRSLFPEELQNEARFWISAIADELEAEDWYGFGRSAALWLREQAK